MDEKTLAIKSLELVKKDLGLGENLEFSDEPLKELHDFLTDQVRYLLDQDFNRLLNAMYRIDISEKKFKEILELADPHKMSQILARVVIEREKQKVFTRKKYSC